MLREAVRRAASAARDTSASLGAAWFSSRLVLERDGPTVVLSPHLDDAVLDCWSVLAGEGDVRVVNVFSGAPRAGVSTVWDRICGAEDSAEQVRVRVAEDAEALALAGRTPLNLGAQEAQYRPFWKVPSLRTLDRALAGTVPRVACLYAPAGLGFEPHPDHALARRLALAAARKGIPVRLYADLPYGSSFGWPHWVTGGPANEHLDVDAYWQRLADDVPSIGDLRSATVVRLSPDDAARKLEAMRAYRTQFPALDGGPIGALRDPLIHGFEVFWNAGGGV